MSQIQCPNCGGFRVERVQGVSFWGYFVAGAWLLLGIGLLLTMPIYLAKKAKESGNPWYEYGYWCVICGYQWLQKPGETLPVRVTPDLIRKGEQRLRQEEQDAQAAAWWYYQQQQNK